MKMPLLITRFEKLLKEHAPNVLHALNPGATQEELETYSARFPDPDAPGVACWLALLRWRNGTSDAFCSLWEGNDLLSMAQSASGQDMMNELEADDVFDRWGPHEWWHPAWVPIFDNHSYDTYAIDTHGCYDGQPGQIISWSKDSEYSGVIAPSFEAWLTAFCDLIEQGAVYYNEDEGGFTGAAHEMINDLISAQFEGFPFYGEARTRLALGLTRTPKPPSRFKTADGYDVELLAQFWAPNESSVQTLTWCGEHGIAVGQNSFGEENHPSLSLIDPEQQRLPTTLFPGDCGVMNAHWMPQHNLIAFLVNSAGRDIWVVDPTTQHATVLLRNLQETRMDDVFDAAGHYVIHAGEVIRRFDVRAPDAEPAIIPIPRNENISGALSPDGTKLAAHGPGGALTIFDTETLTELSSFPIEMDFITKLHWSSDGERLVGIGPYHRSMGHWSLDGIPIPMESTPHLPFNLVTDNHLLVTAGYSSRTEIRDLAGNIVHVDNAHPHCRVYALTVDLNTHTVASGGDDGQIALRRFNKIP